MPDSGEQNRGAEPDPFCDGSRRRKESEGFEIVVDDSIDDPQRMEAHLLAFLCNTRDVSRFDLRRRIDKAETDVGHFKFPFAIDLIFSTSLNAAISTAN